MRTTDPAARAQDLESGIVQPRMSNPERSPRALAPNPGANPAWRRLAVGVASSGAWLVASVLAFCVAARLLAHDGALLLVWINSFTLYLYAPAYVTFLFGLATRRWGLAAVSACSVIAHVAWVSPDYAAGAKEAVENEPHLTLFSGNLLAVNPSTAPLVAEIQAVGADVVLLQEYSTIWDRALTASGALDAYPHRVVRIREDSFGIALYSKLPLRDATVLDVEGIPMARALVRFGERWVEMVNIHTLPPRLSEYLPIWRAQNEWIEQHARRASLPLLLAGDFNATQHSLPYARFQRAGLLDAHREVGRGDATTFPNGVFPVPPIRLDHAFYTRELRCLSVVEGVGKGSDHRPLILRFAWR